ncbi:hypothetical protein CDD83_3897 [Cordyceps sp. RAO-2017]|nr:hypothetical protein CDD83_3897 [Cordyceps sp. RAO-2017]
MCYEDDLLGQVVPTETDLDDDVSAGQGIACWMIRRELTARGQYPRGGFSEMVVRKDVTEDAVGVGGVIHGDGEGGLNDGGDGARIVLSGA